MRWRRGCASRTSLTAWSWRSSATGWKPSFTGSSRRSSVQSPLPRRANRPHLRPGPSHRPLRRASAPQRAGNAPSRGSGRPRLRPSPPLRPRSDTPHARMQRRASTMSMMIRPILRRARRSAFLSTASGPRVWTPVPRSAWTRRAIGALRGPMRRRSPPNRVSRATGLPVVWPIGVVVAGGRSRIVSRTAMTSACRAWSRSFRAAAAGGAGSPAWRPSPFFSARSAVPPGGWSAPAFSRRPRRF